MKLDFVKLRENLLHLLKLKNALDTAGNIDSDWVSGSVIYGMRPTDDLDSIYPDSVYVFSHLLTDNGEISQKNIPRFKRDEYILSIFKHGYLLNEFNQIEIEVKNKEFVLFNTSWNQDLVDDVEKYLSFGSTEFRLRHLGKFKPWYMDECPYTEQPDEQLILPEIFSLSNLDDCIEYLRNISLSKDPNWDCSILDIKFSAGQLYTITKEVYIFHTDEQRKTNRSHAYINEMTDEQSFSILSKELIKNNLWTSWRLFFKTYKNGTSEIFVEDGDTRIVPF